MLGVFYAHFWDLGSHLGTASVRVFFVLSGFLITGILLGLKSHDHGGLPRPDNATTGHGILAFYARRALRIWPIYYAVLLPLVLVNAQDAQDSAVWHLLFASNVWFAYNEGWNPGFAAAWWTLALEEQFYLIWPVIVLALSRKALARLTAGLIAMSLVHHLHLIPGLPIWLEAEIMPLAQIDALGAGALLALAVERKRSAPGWLAPLGLAGLIPTLILIQTDNESWLWIVSLPTMVALVSGAWQGLGGFCGKALDNPMLQGMGRISYGAYVIHLTVMNVIVVASARMGHEINRGPLLFALAGIATFALAWLSWRFYESPILSLKRFFPYRRHDA